jgi:hypothetical protein
MESKRNFIETFMETVINHRDMPKVQVEREISPILEIFIESAMNKLSEAGKVERGKYHLIASEFPISNGEANLRSANIDFLMFNENTKSLVFVELKTDSHSFEMEQFQDYRNIAEANDPKELYEFLGKLEHKKYINYKRLVDKKLEALNIQQFNGVQRIDIIYIAPEKMRETNNHWNDDRHCAIIYLNEKRFLNFNDLFETRNIAHVFAEEWELITRYLKKLDDN